MMKQNHLSIWFIIGLQLTIMGIIILAASIYGLYYPPKDPVKFEDLHPGIYEGAVILVLGIFYSIRFRPGTGRE